AVKKDTPIKTAIPGGPLGFDSNYNTLKDMVGFDRAAEVLAPWYEQELNNGSFDANNKEKIVPI
ncbi:hypothetical protein THAOC_10666, partial [Thalassiosira oceanica]